MLDKALYADSNTQSHYTNASGILELMTGLLGNVEGKRILEPAVGHGAFLSRLDGIPRKIDVVDVDVSALNHVREKFDGSINIIHGDFIGMAVDEGLSASHPLGTYDAVISNPPYGLKFSREYRSVLKSKYPDFYVRESYGLFMKFALERLCDHGRYVFIVPDTFLHSNNHKPLRRFLSRGFSPSQIILFRSRLFETVQFGYGSFCIIAGDRKTSAQHVNWADLRDHHKLPQLADIVWERESAQSFFESSESGWVPPKRKALQEGSFSMTLGDVADCRTGIYTGDNETFLGYRPEGLKRKANGHAIDWATQVRTTALSEIEKSEGVKERLYVPLIRGGHRSPFEETSWAIKWDIRSVAHYRTDKKARLQNARFYFRPGIALPMVTSGRLTASFMENAVFDQGVVGVFPKSGISIPFLLAYLNSSHVSKILKETINPSANNSARYIARIPVPDDLDELHPHDEACIQALKLSDKTLRQAAIDELIRGLTSQSTS
ncbi:N-6 DNA methylase [Rhizobium sp. WYCCWR 11290]|uniref:site-specific DNA-methyltransferase (adenine-specific) n=1 Tax=Rhizobium changzhiense TaxID=2692317 RepID=A0A7Z0UFN6_9HYPH|nr:N-6 DNA methylase [Rhizobium changzhiense]NZD64918.1 N-6 DNA methylase [Rhizobium changzhiense]